MQGCAPVGFLVLLVVCVAVEAPLITVLPVDLDMGAADAGFVNYK